jgi:hypothetical protein
MNQKACGIKTDLEACDGIFLKTTGLNLVFDNPVSVMEMVIPERIQLFADHSVGPLLVGCP